MKPLLIAISGKKQSGKSSLCEYLKAWYRVENELGGKYSILQSSDGLLSFFNDDDERFPEGETLEADQIFKGESPVKVYNFADSLKQVCIDVLGMPWNQCYGTD